MLELNKVYNADCLEKMKEIDDKSIDMILCDLPYGTTARNKWDCIIDYTELWEQYSRIIKDNGAIALFSQPPFDKTLAVSNLDIFRYEWILKKTKATGHLNAKRMPMKAHENLLIFYKKLPYFNPQKTKGHTPVHSYTKHTTDGTNYNETEIGITGGGSTERYPIDVLEFKWDTQKSSLHPTQKPVELCEYFIKTYTKEGQTVLDNCCGSGSTGIACINTNRNYILMDNGMCDKQGINYNRYWVDISQERINTYLENK